MAGHSHWAGIKHKKGVNDAKRGKLFSKLSKNIMIAARDGGLDPTMNLKLRYALDKAKEANMPKVNIERILKKASGEGSDSFSELTYEGYAPGGIAIMVEVVTDNRNRSASELRKLFDNGGGKIGESGCVSYMFDKKGFISIPVSSIDEDELTEIVLEAGAEDLSKEGDYYEITTDPTEFLTINSSLAAKELKIEVAEVMQIPQNTIKLDIETGERVLKLVQKLEDHDDVQNVYANYELSDELIAKMQEE